MSGFFHCRVSLPSVNIDSDTGALFPLRLRAHWSAAEERDMFAAAEQTRCRVYADARLSAAKANRAPTAGVVSSIRNWRRRGTLEQ